MLPADAACSALQPALGGGPRITEAAADQENRGQLSHLPSKGIIKPLTAPVTDGIGTGAVRSMLNGWPSLRLLSCF